MKLNNYAINRFLVGKFLNLNLTKRRSECLKTKTFKIESGKNLHIDLFRLLSPFLSYNSNLQPTQKYLQFRSEPITLLAILLE